MLDAEPDFTERERVVRVQVGIPLFGSEIHVDRLRDRLQAMLALHFPGVEITDVNDD